MGNNIRYSVSNRNKISIYYGSEILNNLDKYLSKICFDKIFIVTSRTVEKLWNEKLMYSLGKYDCRVIIVRANEKNKDIDCVVNLYEQLLREGITKESLIISFGGGVLMDITGFVASIIFRGINLVNIPTTLMSQLECAIGIKYGINTKYGKNMIGNYYCPTFVILDFELLSTNSFREIKGGIAEGIKYAICYDKKLLKEIHSINGTGDPSFKNVLLKIIKVKIKKGNVVNSLMYGHEVGHALEIVTNYSLSHGEAISIGMQLSAMIANHYGYMSDKDLNMHFNFLKKWKLPTRIPNHIKCEDISAYLFRNNNKIELNILNGIGKIMNKEIEVNQKDFLKILKASKQNE